MATIYIVSNKFENAYNGVIIGNGSKAYTEDGIKSHLKNLGYKAKLEMHLTELDGTDSNVIKYVTGIEDVISNITLDWGTWHIKRTTESSGVMALFGVDEPKENVENYYIKALTIE